MAVTKDELAELLARKFGLTKAHGKELLEHFFEIIISELECRRPVTLSGFGNFQLYDKGARPGRNPATGETKEISARRVVSFIAGVKLRLRCQRTNVQLNSPDYGLRMPVAGLAEEGAGFDAFVDILDMHAHRGCWASQ